MNDKVKTKQALILERETRSSIELTRGAKGRFLPGPNHPNWKGDETTVNAARYRAHTVVPVLGLCDECSNKPAMDRHHVDGNTRNYARSNLRLLCRSCHNKAHGRIPPKPDPEVVRLRMTGRIPWNKGLTKRDSPQIRGGRHARTPGSATSARDK